MPGSNVYISSGGAVGTGGSTVVSTTPPAGGATSGGGAAGGAAAGIPVAAYLGAGLGLLQAFNTFTQNSQIADTKGYEDLYTEFGNQEYTGDFNTIIQQRRNAYLGKVPSWKEIRLMNNEAKVGSAITSAGSGALAGAGFGPWGIGIGALIGLGASLLGSQTGDTKAKEEEGRLTMLREKALADNQKNFLSGVKNAEQQVNFNALSNMAAFGGPLHTHGADWTNGITIIDNGGSHESNPFEGVPMGIAPDGKPNLVEEGEVIFNDYVFSDRMNVPNSMRSSLGLSKGKNLTFAKAAKKLSKEAEERPNDPISRRGLFASMSKLQQAQETVRQQNQEGQEGVQYAHGGRLGTLFDGTGPESNYLDSYNHYKDYLDNIYGKNPYPTFTGNVYAQKYHPPYTEAPDNNELLDIARVRAGEKPKGKITPVLEPLINSGSNNTNNTNNSNLAWLRYAPALGAGIGALTDAFGITNRPDYTNADSIMEAARQGIGSIRNVAFTPVGNYLTYRPFDTLFYGNQLASQAGATRRAIRNNSNGNRMTAIAGLLAADYNAQTQLGSLFRQAEEYNLAQKERVENFNRATNEFNSEGLLKAAMANAENAQQKAKIRLTAAEKAAAIRESVDARVGAARSANLTNFFNSLGDIGRERYVMDMIMNNPSLLYDWMGRYKGKLLDDATGKSTSKAKGGYLTIKRRR